MYVWLKQSWHVKRKWMREIDAEKGARVLVPKDACCCGPRIWNFDLCRVITKSPPFFCLFNFHHFPTPVNLSLLIFNVSITINYISICNNVGKYHLGCIKNICITNLKYNLTTSFYVKLSILF